MTVSLPMVSNSEVESFRRCARLHYYRYILRRRPRVDATALVLGTLIHAGLESWFRALMSPNGVSPLDWAISSIEKISERRRADPLLRVQAEELMIGYHCRWIDEPIEVLNVETQFDFELTDPILGHEIGVRAGGKIDAVARWTSDDYIVEHKSSASDLSPGSHYWEKTKISSQIGMYFMGARSLGHQPKGCLYDVIGKPRDAEPLRATPVSKRKYRKDGGLYKGMAEVDEQPEAYRERLRGLIQAEPGLFYARQVVIRLNSDIDSAYQDLVAQVELMRFTEKVGAHPRNPDSCHMYGRLCEYFPVCAGEGSIDDDNVYRTAPGRHEELNP